MNSQIRMELASRIPKLRATSTYPRCANHPSVHSFPTRRSSDLAARRDGRSSDGFSRTSTSSPRTSRAARSEEHTSELQSHVNLVCRLLLEKKQPNPR